MSKYDDAVNKRKAQNAANQASGDTSLTEWAKDGWGFISRGINIVSSKVGEQIEKVAPSDPEARVQQEVVNKVRRDEVANQASAAGAALGAKIGQVGGATVSAATSFFKGALGAVSKEAKARLGDIDEPISSTKSETPESTDK